MVIPYHVLVAIPLFVGGVTGGGILKIIRAASPRCFYTSCYPPGHAEHVPDRFFYIFVLACIFFSEAGAEANLNLYPVGKAAVGHARRPSCAWDRAEKW